MSDIANNPDRSFFRTENIPQSPPPVSTVGIVGWMRQNLFSSPFNTALTLLTLYLLYSVVPPLFQWAFIDSLWQGESNKDCRGIEGACGVFGNGKEQKSRNAAALIARLYQEIGQLKVERDFLVDRSGP